MAAFNSSVSHGNYSYVNPSELRFTQLDINSCFSGKHAHVKLEDAVRDLKAGKSYPTDYPPVEVYRDEEGVIWCNDNRRLYVFRKAGVTSIMVKFVWGSRGKWRSGNHGEQGKNDLNNPDFYPRLRRQSHPESSNSGRAPDAYVNESCANSYSDVYCEEKSESALPGLLVSASAALMAGYASWKLYKQTQSDR